MRMLHGGELRFSSLCCECFSSIWKLHNIHIGIRVHTNKTFLLECALPDTMATLDFEVIAASVPGAPPLIRASVVEEVQ